jgi:putative flippase GtrA
MLQSPTFRQRDRTEQSSSGSYSNQRQLGGKMAANLTSLHPKQILATVPRYAIAGAIGVAVNLLGLHLLYANAQLPLLVASPLSVEFAIVQQYFFHDRWTFGRQYRASLVRFLKFDLASALGLVVNVIVLRLLVAFGMNYLLADLVGIAAATVWNFGSTAWIWLGEKS